MNTTKLCPVCKRKLERNKFARMDQNCPCKDCQAGHNPVIEVKAAITGKEQMVPVEPPARVMKTPTGPNRTWED